MTVTRILGLAQDAGSALAISNVLKIAQLDKSLHVKTVGCGQSLTIFEREGLPHQCISHPDRTDSTSPAELDKQLIDLFSMERPDVLIMGSSRRRLGTELTLEQLSIKLSRISHVPVVMVLDYWGYYEDRFDNPSTGQRNVFLPDWICVMDHLAARQLIARGISRDSIEITGNPHYDDIVETLKQEGFVHRRSQRADSLNVLYQSQPILEDFGTASSAGSLGYTQHSAFKNLFKALSECSSTPVNLSVRKHLREPKNGHWETTWNSCPVDRRVRLNFGLPSQKQIDIAEYDLVISHFSTTLIESIYRAVPTISYQPGQNFTDSFLANKLGLSLPAYDFAGLKRALNTALDPKYPAQLRKRRDIMRRNALFFSNGNAAQKVLDVVKRCQPS